jgi:hypothetical protein
MADCGCGNGISEASNIPRLDQPVLCPAVVHETVCVQAEVTITPDVTVGEIESFCVGGPVIGACPGTPVDKCSFVVSQNICVQVPLNFSALATVDHSAIVCATPSTGTCV